MRDERKREPVDESRSDWGCSRRSQFPLGCPMLLAGCGDEELFVARPVHEQLDRHDPRAFFRIRDVAQTSESRVLRLEMKQLRDFIYRTPFVLSGIAVHPGFEGVSVGCGGSSSSSSTTDHSHPGLDEGKCCHTGNGPIRGEFASNPLILLRTEN